jgi:hypothetical protein
MDARQVTSKVVLRGPQLEAKDPLHRALANLDDQCPLIAHLAASAQDHVDRIAELKRLRQVQERISATAVKESFNPSPLIATTSYIA